MKIKEWPTERKKLSELKPADYNPRDISDEALAGLEQSLIRFGMVQPIVWNKRTGNIVGGHQRFKVLLQQGLEEVDVTVIDVPESQEVALNITLNNPANQGTFSDGAVDIVEGLRDTIEPDDFKSLMFPDLLSALGAKDDDDGGKKGNTDPDAVPEKPEDAISTEGSVYQLGEHRLGCGSSLDESMMGILMDGELATLVMTSPPYWVGKSYEVQENWEEVKAFVWGSAKMMAEYTTKDGGRIIINTSTAQARAVEEKAPIEVMFILSWWQDALREHDWLMRHCRVWVKHGQMAAPAISPRSDVVDQHWETLVTFYNKLGIDEHWDGLAAFYNPKGLYRGQNRVGTKWAQLGVWDDIPGTANAFGHGAVFPVEIPLRFISLYGEKGEVILEPFCGSGTTMIAAEKLGRRCFGMELDPLYCDIIRKRWAEFVHGEDCKWEKLTPQV